MDIPNEFQEVRVFFADDGSVPILEEVGTSFMAFVEGDDLISHEATHDLEDLSSFNPSGHYVLQEAGSA